MYWGADSRLYHVADVMTRDRWKEIKSFIHFNNNSNMPSQDDMNKDKLFKVWPIIDHLLLKFQSNSSGITIMH